MNKIITALKSPYLNDRLKSIKEIEVILPDIEEQEELIEIIEARKEIDILILSEEIKGDLNFYDFINLIKNINNKLEIIIILKEENKQKINYLKSKNINKIFFNNKSTINEIINLIKIKKENNEKNISEEIEKIKKLITENKTNNNKINLIKNFFNKKRNKIENQNNKLKMISISGNRGSGKTLFAACLIKELKKINKKTLIIDFDILNNNLNTILGCKKTSNKNNYLINSKNNINYNKLKIKINKNVDLILGTKILFNETDKNDLNKINYFLEKIKLEYELIIIDTSSECFFDYTKIILEKSDKIIFLTQGNLLEIHKSKRLLEIYINEWKIDSHKFNILFNKYNINSIAIPILKNIFSEFNILGEIKLNKKYNLLINKNMKSKIKNDYKKIINNILEMKYERKILWKN